jgi:hypothetical protein
VTRREIIASAIANARAGRRGAPPIVNVLEILPAKLRAEVLDDADAVVAADTAPGELRDIAEIGRLRRWVSDLQSGMYVNCVYCGHRYGPKDQVMSSMADALKLHVASCQAHPMARLVAELKDIDDVLAYFLRGVGDRHTLEEMRKDIAQAIADATTFTAAI